MYKLESSRDQRKLAAHPKAIRCVGTLPSQVGDSQEVWQTDGQSIISTFITPAYSTSNPWSSSKKPSEVVSFHLLPDSRMLVLIMRGGEIATVSLDEEILAVSTCTYNSRPANVFRRSLNLTWSILQVEVVGSFESGILAAS